MDMEIIIILLAVLQSMAISLGVGSSTLAIINFFVAIADGKIDESERNMMGVVYIVLRVAMVAILVTTGLLALLHITQTEVAYLTSFKMAVWTLIAVLYINAILMTKHLISSSFGPSIQAGTWYTLGGITALLPLNLDNFTYIQFCIGYATVVVFAIVLVNGVMLHLKKKKEQTNT